MKHLSFIIALLLFNFHVSISAQSLNIKTTDSLNSSLFVKGKRNVNKCTPWHHIKCVYITGKEVYLDGKQGEKSRHWWHMSYIGEACSDTYGKTFGVIFEGLFAIPHYIGVAIGNSVGYLAYLIRGSEEKITARKTKRKKRREYKGEKLIKPD